MPCTSSPEPAAPSTGQSRDVLQDLDLRDIEIPGTAQALEFFGDL
ncbi:hypothetical protein [Streptomyces sp. NPDC018352]